MTINPEHNAQMRAIDEAIARDRNMKPLVGGWRVVGAFSITPP